MVAGGHRGTAPTCNDRVRVGDGPCAVPNQGSNDTLILGLCQLVVGFYTFFPLAKAVFLAYILGQMTTGKINRLNTNAPSQGGVFFLRGG